MEKKIVLISLKELSKILNINKSKLTYYSVEKLIEESEIEVVSSHNIKFYDLKETIERIEWINQSRAAGLSLKEIKQLIYEKDNQGKNKVL